MRTYWKQFTAWATSSKDRTWRGSERFFREEVLQSARFKLVIAAILSIIVFTLVVDAVFGYERQQALVTIENSRALSQEERGLLAAEFNEIDRRENYIEVFIGAAASVLLYFATNVVLRPVKKTMEDQKRFMADAAHELRTPLSIIKTSSEIFLRGGASDETLADAVKLVKSNVEEVDRMAKIIENLLFIARYANRSQTPFYKLNFSELVSLMVKRETEWSKTIKEKRIRLASAKYDWVQIWGNPAALEQMVKNLLDNAISYTPAGGSVMVSVVKNNQGEVELTVKDNGRGISPEDLPKIMEPFYRAGRTGEGSEKEDAKVTGHAGLGLALVNEIVRLHRGRINIKSKLNKGTIVRVTFPHAA